MKEEEIISSGLLELYVTGGVSTTDSEMVREAMAKYPSVVKEIEAIEKSLITLSEGISTEVSPTVWNKITSSIASVKVLPATSKSSRLPNMLGWAAAILCFAGLFWMMKDNNELKDSLRYTILKNAELKDEIKGQGIALEEMNNVLSVIRSTDYAPIDLPGNVAVAPNAYATVYFNTSDGNAYIDGNGLPTPPEGKVYQVWSLTLDPLTPTSIGLLNEFETTNTRFFKVENIPSTEAFGITLEPAGGSKSPNLDQLYTLGTVAP